MKPYLSVIIAARNDNYGGNFLGRMQTFVDGFLSLASDHFLPAELIIVEWNPPEDRPRLRDVLGWPRSGNTVQVRLLEVPPEIHRRMPYSEKLPMFDCFAKNVGARRAKGT